jgi:predicted unusual protein kinase regulating ubiquinone biosynthesis (AarF/ABC1/UbiB family)
MPTVAQLIQALPEHESTDPAQVATSPVQKPLSLQPVPMGRLRRIGLLGTLQAKIAAAYLFYWIRGWFKDAAEKEKLLAETHWRTAAQVLHSMGYLRGAVMKVGQTLANFPDIAPEPFVQTLEQLHFHAPPMHWSLLREMVHNELEDDPENIFQTFDKRAFAAASLGQVHRATLTRGQAVVVKIQYPGIGRTIGQDLSNLLMFMLPARLSADWQNMREQFDDLRMRLEHESDYEREAATLQKARSLFSEADGIVIPRVFPEHSTRRVLTMEYLGGVHLDEFLAGDPPAELRNEFARKMLRAWYRMLFAGRMLYVDFHPGNFLFMDDGRLGIVDFGCMVELDETLWDLFRKMDRPLTTGKPEDREAVMKEWCWIGDDPADADRRRLIDEYTDWSWRARYCGCEFDFGDETEFRRGIDLFTEMVRKRYSRGRPATPMMARQHMGWWSMLYRLKAKVRIAPIAEEEVRASGWDRSSYAPAK